jgi:DNA-binding MarR family transcriptional regulator
LGLGTARASALSVIVFAVPLGIGRLAEIEQVRAPTMTRLVDRLEAAGLVQRIRDPKDRRNVGVHATPAGRRILEGGRARRVGVLATAMRSLPAGDLRALERSAAILESLTLEY